MFAVIETGGKQYKVEPKTFVRVELLDTDDKGFTNFERVLLLQDANGKLHIGQPTVDGAWVVGRLRREAKGKKVIIFKFRRRKHKSKNKKGHRQWFAEFEILGMGLGEIPAELFTAVADEEVEVVEVEADDDQFEADEDDEVEGDDDEDDDSDEEGDEDED